MTFDPIKGHMTYAGWVIDHYDQVSLKSIKAARRYIRLYGWQKKKKKKLDLETDLDTVAWYLLAEVTPSWPWPHEWNWGSQAYVFI